MQRTESRYRVRVCAVPQRGPVLLWIAARAALVACVGGLAVLTRVCRRWFPALVSDFLRLPNHRVSL